VRRGRGQNKKCAVLLSGTHVGHREEALARVA
jgi:hypothetical protein